MARRFENVRPGVLLLALAIALFLWGVAHGSSSIERTFDLPVALYGMPETLVVTDQSVDAINVRVMGSRAALNNLDTQGMSYTIDVSGAKTGVAVYDTELGRIELPRGARFVSHSPSRVQVRFEKRGRKAVGVRADLEGEPAPGYHVAGIFVQPSRVWLAGARSQVMRLTEVVTEPIDITGLTASQVKEVRLFLGGGTVWMENKEPVKVEVRVEADVPAPEPVVEGVGEDEA